MTGADVPAPGGGTAPPLDPVVAAAMVQLTGWTYHRHRRIHQRYRNVVLRSRGLRDPSSRSAAIHVFTNLRYHGYAVDPSALHDWAAAHGWRPSDARALADYADGVRSGRRYHTVSDPFGHRAIDLWRASAAAAGPSS